MSRRSFGFVLLVGLALGFGVEAGAEKNLTALRAAGALHVCADPNNLPFSSSDPSEPGYDVELARAIAAELGVRAEMVWIPTLSGRTALRQLLEGKCDLFPGLPLDPRFTDDNPRLALTVPYYTLGHAVVIRERSGIRSLQDLHNRLVAVEQISIADIYAWENDYPRVPYRTQTEAFEAVGKGDVDAAILWAPIAGFLALKRPDPPHEILRIRNPELEFKMGMGVRRADGELKATVDQVLARYVRDGRVDGILRRYGAAPPPPKAASLPPRDVAEGERVYFSSCAHCHGPEAEGGSTAPSLKKFLGSDDQFTSIVLAGRPGTPMPPWQGLLEPDTILKIRAFTLAKRSETPSDPLNENAKPSLASASAKEIFLSTCAACHGAQGAGGPIAPSLRTFKGSDEEFVKTVLTGRPGTPMISFRGIIPEEKVREIRALIKSGTFQ